MKTIVCLTLLLLSTLAQAEELWLALGEHKNLFAKPDAVIRIGSRGIVRAVESGSGIRVIGLKVGTSTLAIDDKSYLVKVTASQQKEFVSQLRAMVADMMGLSVVTDLAQVTLTGTLLRFSDWLKIKELAESHQGEYIFAAQALPDVAQTALPHLKNVAAKGGVPILRFTTSPDFKAHIPSSGKNLQTEAERLLKPYGIQVEEAASDLTVEPLVRTRVILAELSKSFSQEFGVQWPGQYTAQVLPTLKGEDSLMVTLKSLEAEGRAQILASPTLLCRSGGEADFHAGGEFPIRVATRFARDVMWKSHGVILSVKPKADFHGAISLEIETEVSLLDMANAVEGIPAIKKNRVKSHFDLTGRKTVALSGLLRQEMGRASEGLSWLTSLPVLGPLFSSRKFMNHQTELVIFVTPEIFSADRDEPIEMPSGWVRDGL